MKLALRGVVESRPVRAMKALLMRAQDARALLSSPRESRTPVEKVRGLSGSVLVARDAAGVPGIFASTREDVAFGMGWACAEDRLFQMELTRRALRGELAATFGDRPVDEKALTRMMAGRTFVDLDAFTRAMGFRAAAEASYAIATSEARAWVDAYALGVDAYVASGRRPLEMLLLDIEPQRWTGADCFLVGKGTAFQLTFSYRFALAHALVTSAVDAKKSAALRPAPHPLTVTRGDAMIDPLIATTEVLRAVLGAEGMHLGSNAFAVGPSRSTTGRAMVASDPHMPLTAPAVFWEVRLSGGDLDVRGATIPGYPGIAIGQNVHAAWGVTAGWGDDSQLYREDLSRLRAEGRLRSRFEAIEVRGEKSREVEILETPRGPVVSHVIGHEIVDHHERGLVLRWSGQDATQDVDSALGIMRARSFDDLRAALRYSGGPSLNFVFADDRGHIGWHFAGRIPRRVGNLDPPSDVGSRVSGVDILDGEDPRGHWQGYVPSEELPFVVDPKDQLIVSANARPVGNEYRHHLGEIFEPPFRMARIRALLDAYGQVGPLEIAAIQRDVRSSWALQVRDALLRDLGDDVLALSPRRGRDLVRLVRAWDGRAEETSAGAAAMYALLDAVTRHVFLEDLGDLAFERYFEIMNTSVLPLLQVLGDDASAWLEGRDRATIVRDAAAMAEGRLRRWLGEDPNRWQWGLLHTLTFRHAFADIPGLRTISSPGPYPARGDGTTVCMGEYDMRGGFHMRVGPALRFTMQAGAPSEGLAILPPGQSGDPASRHYRDQVGPYLQGDSRRSSWDEIDFRGRRTKLSPA